MELDIDFENYSVPTERKQEVRSFVEALKQEPWVADLKTLVAELGVDDMGTSGEPALPGMLEETKARIYRAPEGTPAFGFEAMIQGSELKVYFERKIWMEIHFLPKGADFIVFFVDESSFDAFRQKMIEIDEITKAAKGKKSTRAAEWKARFAPKAAAAEAPAVATETEAVEAASAESSTPVVEMAVAGEAPAPTSDQSVVASSEEIAISIKTEATTAFLSASTEEDSSTEAESSANEVTAAAALELKMSENAATSTEEAASQPEDSVASANSSENHEFPLA